MKHLKLFENFENIDEICNKYGINNYTINNDVVDVNGSVNLSHMNLVKLPISFGRVTGHFNCRDNRLATLEGGPKEVGGDFYCNWNKLTTLEGCPKEVGGDFNCNWNKLTTLEGCPKEVGGNFYCSSNQLTSLEGGPKEVGIGFYCSSNQLTSLEGGPKEVDGLYCNGNPISQIYNLFGTHKEYLNSLDYNYLRGNDIVKSRFEEALEEIGKELPKEIKGYNYI